LLTCFSRSSISFSAENQPNVPYGKTAPTKVSLLYHEDPVPLIKDLIEKNTFIVRVIPYSEKPITAAFDVHSLKAQMEGTGRC
jgi:hypothetical protein